MGLLSLVAYRTPPSLGLEPHEDPSMRRRCTVYNSYMVLDQPQLLGRWRLRERGRGWSPGVCGGLTRLEPKPPLPLWSHHSVFMPPPSGSSDGVRSQLTPDTPREGRRASFLPSVASFFTPFLLAGRWDVASACTFAFVVVVVDRVSLCLWGWNSVCPLRVSLNTAQSSWP